ncbi:MAG: DUF349 domain-containing protein [Cytophagales bacterium]
MSDKEKSEKKVANPSKSAVDNKQNKELKNSSKEPKPVEDKVDKPFEDKVDKAEKKVDKAEKKVDKAEKKVDKAEKKVDKAKKKVEIVEKGLEKDEEKKEKLENESETPEVNPAKQLKKKKEIIRVLRELVDGVENKDTFNNVKDLQNAWKDIGHINNSKDKSLWTTYNALLDRFYDNRSIYFELKDLDRKKNLELKNAICEKAEKLVDNSNIMRAVSSLNELHAEFKHIGPVERDKQEDIWNRLKNASDEVYKKKKDFIANIKESLNENLEKKSKLLDEINKIKNFKSDKFKEWNNKTKEVLSLKDKWNSIGGVPKSSTRNISKEFWNSFKEFFSNKSKFFKKIDDSFKANLDLKKALVDKVNELKSSDDWENTSKEIQSLQQEWKKIGKVPMKNKDSIFKEFKDACDIFYERMRVEDKDTIKMHDDNLEKKLSTCEAIEKLFDNKEFDQDEFFKLQVKFLEIGHVPKDKVETVKEKFKKTIDVVVEKSSSLMNKDDFDKFKFIIELNSLAKNPYSKNKIIKKKSDLIKKINAIQSEIKNLKNNIYYLKESVAAENLKKEYMEKINNSDKEIESLKLQLNLINKV